MATKKFTAVLLVEAYIDDEDPDAEMAFEDCSTDLDSAREELVEFVQYDMELPKADFDQLTFGAVEFIEFDSSNWTHAGAYFEVEVTGPEDLLQRIEDALDR